MRANPQNTKFIIPRKLYKYYSVNDNLYNVISSHSCWFSKPSDFNDPFDCNLDISIGESVEEIIDNMRKSSMLHLFMEELAKKEDDVKMAGERIMNKPYLLKRIINEVHKYFINQNIGVYCLSEDPKNILMWSHYSNSHKGVCIEFEIKRGSFFYNNLLPVQYKKRYPKFELSDYQNEDNMMFTMHQQAVCTKSVLWQYEKEWRVIVDDGFGLKSFDINDVTKVIFGAKISKDDKEKLLASFKDNGYKTTKFYQCRLSNHRYGLDTIRIAQ